MKTSAWIPTLCLLALNLSLCHSLEKVDKPSTRDSKLLPIFQVVRFPNDICAATSRNGTCYTAEECSSRGGTSGGSCASGFGVCCVFELACGGTTSDNSSYLVQSSTTSLNSPCLYTVCPCNNNICRIRYDFTTFVIGAQSAGTAAADGTTIVNEDYIGACSIDTFTITTPGTQAPPLICGTNTGYHMVTDVHNAECQVASFSIGPATTTTRSWDIKITQYACGDEDKGGPPGCLQYFTGTSGVVASYAFTATTVVAATTHLQNQNYENCFRREKSYCYMCYYPTITATTPAAIIGNSFGVSVSAAAAIAQSGTGTVCSTDYLVIPGATTSTLAATTTFTAGNFNKICGRFFTITTATAITLTVCTRTYPFRIGVKLDGTEVQSTASIATTNEQDLFPGGIVGFKLYWWQTSC